MLDAWVFVTDVSLTVGVAISVVGYLKPSLKKILVDLCGTEDRATFWTAFSNLTLVLMPVIFAMHYRPNISDTASLILEISTQIEWALIGLVITVFTLGIVIGSFIPRGGVKPRS